MVGGTSIGAFVSAMYALHGHDEAGMAAKMRRFCSDMSSVPQKVCVLFALNCLPYSTVCPQLSALLN